MFVLVSDMSAISRLDSKLTNMKMPWEKDAPPVIVTVGAVELFGQISNDIFKYERLWTKSFSS